MRRAQKTAAAVQWSERFASRRLLVAAQLGSAPTAYRNALADSLAASGVELMLAKNSTLRHALKGGVYQALAPLFEGQMAVAMAAEGAEPVAAARAILKAASEPSNYLLPLGAVYEGRILSAQDLRALSKLKPPEQLYAHLAEQLRADPLKAGLANLLQPPQAFPFVLPPTIAGLVDLLGRAQAGRAGGEEAAGEGEPSKAD